MAESKMSLEYDWKKNQVKDSKMYGKYYAVAVKRDVLSLKGLARHIAEHGSVYTEDVVYGVLMKMRSCVVELCEQGYGVKLDGLGQFYVTLESTGAELATDLDIGKHLQGIHLRFLPEGSTDEALTSRALAKSVPMKQRHIWGGTNGRTLQKVKDGQFVDYDAADEP